MVKSNFGHLGVYRKLERRATTFVLGIWGHVVEKVVKKLGFSQKLGFCTKSCSPRGQKFKEMALEKNFVPTGASGWL